MNVARSSSSSPSGIKSPSRRCGIPSADKPAALHVATIAEALLIGVSVSVASVPSAGGVGWTIERSATSAVAASEEWAPLM